ncbi:PPOX class F420-dependent oxidoreductase [Amycolatopsis cihanbeyliensis]|uniref:Pyridoxamine 5'-phosphate oxidase family protein n=1 Tax=Amycolatopsis cihanbeyliensis TaxID=1128664 RepID=A0A542CUM6_AMYCI|nr:PPOX class F420-dependent oxidoreductase [Amycolatopsis cihanbeyliensis]TQI94500.1 pyridoxamine 5'-phosphate oxidase family protein [Amycolatopsis cihanbeyliensis]
MNVFSTAEFEYLRSQPLARLATVGADGMPRVKPVGFLLDTATGGIVIGGYAGTGMASSRKFRDVQATAEVALVVDDLAEVDPWTPRGVEIRGRAEARTTGGAETGERLGAAFPLDPAWILVVPRRVVSWGLAASAFEVSARDVLPKAG